MFHLRTSTCDCVLYQYAVLYQTRNSVKTRNYCIKKKTTHDYIVSAAGDIKGHEIDTDNSTKTTASKKKR